MLPKHVTRVRVPVHAKGIFFLHFFGDSRWMLVDLSFCSVRLSSGLWPASEPAETAICCWGPARRIDASSDKGRNDMLQAQTNPVHCVQSSLSYLDAI